MAMMERKDRIQGASPEATVIDLGFKPLYRIVRDKLVRRLVDGYWSPGAPLPSEMQLAAELGVSQGTVRKALNEMERENLVVRRQGRGTFVARHDEERILFQFFKLTPDTGGRQFPESRVASVRQGLANAAERSALNLGQKARVVRIRRLRVMGAKPAIAETIVLPEALFPGLATTELPNNLYGLYAMRYGITVARARETLKAVSLGAEDAELLGIAAGIPVLLIDRIALSLEGTPVEWRVSACLTDEFHYLSDLK